MTELVSSVPIIERFWGLREFSVRDLDGNLVTFFEAANGTAEGEQ